jgi:bile acid:Na+ symporter, BASS family
LGSTLTSVVLPISLAVVMFGLGLSLTVADFTRVRHSPRAVVVALCCQLLVLPAVCFGLVLLLDLEPVHAAGMMLLAASPGGASANLFSHLFRGDVALNISLTAINSVLSVLTLPLVTGFALAYFDPPGVDDGVGLQLGKVLQVVAIVLVPVLVGMLVRRAAPAFSARMDRPVRILSVLVLVAVVTGTVIAERENVTEYLSSVGPAATVFCLISLTTGYVVPRWFGIGQRQAIACSMEIGVHNSALAITIAISVLDSTALAVPAAVYSLAMFVCAALVGRIVTRRALAEESLVEARPVPPR